MKFKFSNSVSIIALVASIIALWVSCESLRLSKENFAGDRLVVWKGRVNKESNKMFLEPVNKEISLQGVTIYYPPALNDFPWIGVPPKYSVSTYLISNEILEHLKKSCPKHQDQDVCLVTKDSMIPIIIDSNYIAKGRSLFDRSLYLLRYECVLPDKKLSPPLLNITGLSFVYRLSNDIDPHQHLDNLWKNYNSFVNNH